MRASSAAVAVCSKSRSTTAAPQEIATRARGTPRVANNLINFVRDFAQERANGKSRQPVAAAALELLEIDAAGLDEMDKRMLRVMAENYRGGPVGMAPSPSPSAKKPKRSRKFTSRS